MKKILTLTLVVMLMLTLASCSWMGKIKDIFVPNNTDDNNEHVCTGTTVVVTEPTCSTVGENAIVCTICNKTMETVEVAKLQHTVINVNAIAATCTSDGRTAGTKCSVCNEVLSGMETIASPGHAYDSTVTAPKCEVNGYTTYTCSICNHTYQGDNTDATGHTPGDEWILVEEPTASNDGLRQLFCSVCGVWIDEETVPAIGSEGLAYELNANGTGYIVTGIGECTDTEVYIPNFHYNLPVVEIASLAFCGIDENGNPIETKITKLVVSDSVTKIGMGAFAYSNVETVTIGNGVTAIPDACFYECRKLTSVILGSSVQEIGSEAFSATSVQMIHLDETHWTNAAIVKEVVLICKDYATTWNGGIYIGNATNPYAIMIGVEDKNAAEYTIHSDTKVLYSTFVGCKNVASITVPDSVVAISTMTFMSCDSLTTLYLPKEVTVNQYAIYHVALTDIYYAGTQADWETYVTVAQDAFLVDGNVTWHYLE